MTVNKTMLLVTAPWSQDEVTFRMIPASLECPYIDVVYNKDKSALEIVSAFKRNEYGMFAKVDENGDVEKRKHPNEQKVFKQERRVTEILQKYFILEQSEIINFVQTFAINADKIDYMRVFSKTIVEAPKASIIMP